MHKHGHTLIQVVVVLAIIAILLGLLLLRIHYSREAARRTACQNNLHTVSAALQLFVKVYKKLPDRANDGTIGGWEIAVLSFIEDSIFYGELTRNPPLDPLSLPSLARHRPFVLTCPSAYNGDSSIKTVPASHYSAFLARKGQKSLTWEIGDVSIDSRMPWVTSPEARFWWQQRPPTGGPHADGYNVISGSGSSADGGRFLGQD